MAAQRGAGAPNLLSVARAAGSTVRSNGVCMKTCRVLPRWCVQHGLRQAAARAPHTKASS